MNSLPQNEFVPDYVPCPGLTLRELMESAGMSQEELAGRTSRPTKTINEIINGKAAITPETALQLERVFRVPARFWNNLESQYREHLARQAEDAKLSACIEWLNDLPVNEMVRYGWVRGHASKIGQLREVLSFFGVASPKAWDSLCAGAAYRHSRAFRSKPGALAAWLRKGEIDATAIATASYDPARFEKQLYELRALTLSRDTSFVRQLQEECAACGVAVVFVHELKGTSLSGSARWITPSKALIQLTLRHKRDDQLWFSFFHEAAHILRHGKRGFFIDEENGDESGDKEVQANAFAADVLIPPQKYRPWAARSGFTESAVRLFAADVGVAPGIVVGRLQHDGLVPWRSYLNRLKKRFEWAA